MLNLTSDIYLLSDLEKLHLSVICFLVCKMRGMHLPSETGGGKQSLEIKNSN